MGCRRRPSRIAVTAVLALSLAVSVAWGADLYSVSLTLRNETGTRVNQLQVELANPIASTIVAPPFNRYTVDGTELLFYDPFVPVLPGLGASLNWVADRARPSNILSYQWLLDSVPIGNAVQALQFRTEIVNGNYQIQIVNPSNGPIRYSQLRARVGGAAIPLQPGVQTQAILAGQESLVIAVIPPPGNKTINISFVDQRCGTVYYY